MLCVVAGQAGTDQDKRTHDRQRQGTHAPRARRRGHHEGALEGQAWEEEEGEGGGEQEEEE